MLEDKKETIAAFDFDGTITTKDTLFDFIRFYHGTIKLVLGLIILSPMLVLYKLGAVKNYKAKEILISYFFKNQDIGSFTHKCELYRSRIDEICRPHLLDKIKWHKQQGHRVIIISASIRNWIEPWGLENGIDKVISTELKIKNKLITGKFSSKNCYGQEKVNRLIANFPNRQEYILYAYGDSRGDRELLNFSDHPSLIKE